MHKHWALSTEQEAQDRGVTTVPQSPRAGLRALGISSAPAPTLETLAEADISFWSQILHL